MSSVAPSLSLARADDPSLISSSRPHPLDPFFAPRAVAVIGASETPGSVGRTLLWNLISSPFGGVVYPVNPKRRSILGIRAYPSVAEVPDEVDLAVVITPAPSVPGIVKQCAEAGIKNVIVISAGFKEVGEAGALLERQLLAIARENEMRIVGPNCLGVMSPLSGLNATFAADIARPGNVAFLSQSGALCTAILDWSLREEVGFSAFVSLGSMLDVSWGDLISYLGDDPRTQSILLYMESVGDARAFLSAAREVALSKPIIVIKAGRTEAAAQAAASHTGTLAGSDDVLEAAFRRSGVLRVERIAELFSMAEVLAKQPRPNGKRLTVVTNAGGPGVLATDALISGGGELAPLSEATMTALNEALPAPWSHGNPVDVLGDAGADRYARAVELCAKNPESDGLLVILTPQDMTDPTRTAQELAPYARSTGKPLLASWMGEGAVEEGNEILSRAGIPNFSYPDTAVRAFNTMWRYSDNLRLLYETPTLEHDDTFSPPDREHAARVISEARQNGRELLTEAESKELLSAYGVPTVETRIATTIEAALQAAREIGFPVVLKLHSFTVTHKTDVGGVRLNLKDESAVREAFELIRGGVKPEEFDGITVQPMAKLDGYELIIGSSLDPQFGPVLLFGTGGQLVEVFKDSSLALPPLNSTLARRLMERTRIFEALEGVRGRKSVDIGALEALLVRFSLLVVEHPQIKELDINPLFASPERLLALDARVVLHPNTISDEDLPRPAIRPYPGEYVSRWTARGGDELTLRPIRPEDEPLLVRFHETLSPRTVEDRFAAPLDLAARVDHARLVRRVFTDYEREIALVAVRQNEGESQMLGAARLVKLASTEDATFALVVSDEFQNQGLGGELLRRLIEVARHEKVARLRAHIGENNEGARRLLQKHGFSIGAGIEERCEVEMKMGG